MTNSEEENTQMPTGKMEGKESYDMPGAARASQAAGKEGKKRGKGSKSAEGQAQAGGDMPSGEMKSEDESSYAQGSRMDTTEQSPTEGLPAETEMPGGEMEGEEEGGDGEEGGMPGGGMGGGGTGGGGNTDPEAALKAPPPRRTCATMEVHNRLLRESPAYAAARTAIENEAWAFATGRATARAVVVRIPVVVHVVWKAAQENVSEAQIRSQIDVLNRDFRMTNADIGTVPAPFQPLRADAEVEFFLATTDPAGNPTNGITRRNTTVTAFSGNDDVKFNTRGGTDAWPANRYLNLWVCPLSGGLLGYAQFPGGAANTDGVVIAFHAFGTTGTAAAPFHLGRTATHEIGHWLNLRHIWGDDIDGCSGSDLVDDTPNQAGANTGVPAFPHVTCSNGPNGDMFMNYMDYVDDRAMVMFSRGQVTRMRACLEGPRASFITPTAAGTARVAGPVVSWGANRIDTFVIGTDRALYHKWWNGSAWGPSLTGYERQGGVIVSSAEVASWGPNRLDAFVVGTDRALYHKWWNGSAWGPSLTGYERQGGIIVSKPKAVCWGPNRIDLFVVGTDSALYHKWWNGSAWGPSLTGYEGQGGVIVGDPEAVSWGPNRLDVFVLGTDQAVYHKWWNGSSWGPSLTGYERMGGVCQTAPKAVCWGPNRIDLFVVGTDRALYHKWWNGSAWGPSLTGWENLGGVCASEPAVVSWGPNRLDVFVLGTDSAVYHKWWNGSSWGPSLTGYERMGGVCTSPPRAVCWGPNRIDLFVTGTDSALYHKWWNGSAWGPSLTGYEGQGGVIVDF